MIKVTAQTRCYFPMVVVRDAKQEEAAPACQVVRRSIVELCSADHRNDPFALDGWLANKTAEIFSDWIMQPQTSFLLAVENDDILGVGSVTDAGMIGLNYVLPVARFRGVSRAILLALEQRALERGATLCTLTSTATARRFYRANGYAEDGVPVGGTLSGYPMSKGLLARYF